MAEVSVNNGVNVEALLAARAALTEAPEAAKFRWRASCKWKNGTHSTSSIEGFHGLGEEQKHKTEFSFDVDHPEVFASEDLGCDAYRAGARRACQLSHRGRCRGRATSWYPAEVGRGQSRGAMDIQGILGIDSDVRNGYDNIKVHFNIDADASQQQIEALVAQSQKRSAVYDCVTNPTNVTVQVNKQ